MNPSTLPALHFLLAFVAVATNQSFRKAAAELGVSTSALSHSIRELESQLGARLFNRTTRSVAVTDAGERLLRRVRPALDDIREAVEETSLSSGVLRGTLRINAPKLAAIAVLAPALPHFAESYPGIELEVSVENSFVDIVADGFDAGIRFGDTLQKDMIATQIGSPLAMAVVGSPSYFEHRTIPRHPRDLASHSCIGLRFGGRGERYAWEFERLDETLNIDVRGPLTTDDPELALRAAISGLGLAYVGLPYAEEPITNGILKRVLDDWCPPSASLFLYYPNRRHMSSALRVFIDHVRNIPII
jgi:DNA-binding transcriptional LysR family regulator